MRCYLYALAGGNPGELPPGIGGREVFVVEHEGIPLVASTWGEAPPPPVDEPSLLGHEAVVEAAMQAVTILPFRFGTVGDEPACRRFVESHADRIRDRLRQVEGQVEVSLKVIDRSGATHRPPAPAPGSGLDYLLHRRCEAQREQERTEQARRLVAEMEADLAPWFTDRRHRLAPGRQIVAAITHLVPRSSVEPWANAVTALRARYPGLDFLASGPWPPYHFAEVTDGGDGRADPHSGAACER